MRIWLALAATVLAALLIVELADRPPRPLGLDAPPTVFSEARARVVTEHLAETIGLRVIGTPGRDAAADYLIGELRRIPGVEVEVQDVETVRASPWAAGAYVAYTARNVLARLPGDSTSAVLVSAHYDSPPESVGAGDNAAAVGVALEALRVLAGSPRLRHTVIVNFNDGEEAGLLGVQGFVDHPWIPDVRAFINLESAGPRGKAILFQTGPGNSWLTKAYARSVPRPYGTVIGQDIFQGGLIPSDTDFRIYRDDAGLRGLDIAFYQDDWAYHTLLDRVDRLEPGGMQHMGDNLVALVRELADGDLPGDVGGESAVYYDVLGLHMFVHESRTMLPLAAAAAFAAMIAAAIALRRSATPRRDLAAGMLYGLFGCMVGMGAAVAAGVILGFVLDRPHGWFAAPWIAALAFAPPALAGFAAIHAIWEYRATKRGVDPLARANTAWAGAAILAALPLVILAILGFGAAYLWLWWTVPLTLGLVVASLLPERWWWPAFAAAFVPGLLLMLQAGTLFLKLFIPVSGRFPLPFPFDPIIAGIVAVVALAIAVPAFVAAHRAGGFGRAALAFLALGILGGALAAVRHPYSPERPKRLLVEHVAAGDAGHLRVTALDYPDAGPALRGLDLEPTPAAGRERRGFQRYQAPTPPPELPPSVVTVGDAVPALPGPLAAASPAEDAAGATDAAPSRSAFAALGPAPEDALREVTLSVGPGAPYMLEFHVPASALAGWSLGDPPTSADGNGIVRLRVMAPPPDGFHARITLRGEPVDIRVVETYAPFRTAAIDSVLAALPVWTTPHFRAIRTRTFTR